MLVTSKQRMASEANLRPCLECTRKKGLIVMVEQRCENMKERPFGKARKYVRCTNGMCKEHDTYLTILNKEVEHICPDCFVEEMRKSFRSA